jgi:hypothetical protein
MKAQSVGGGWSGVVTGYPLVIIYVWTSFSFRTTTNSSSICNMFLWFASSQLKRRTDDSLQQHQLLFALCFFRIGGLGPRWRLLDSCLAETKRGGEEHDNEENRAYKIECIWKENGRFRAAALKALVIDHCDTGASMQVGLVSRSCPPLPPPTQEKLRTRDPYHLPTAGHYLFLALPGTHLLRTTLFHLVVSCYCLACYLLTRVI